MPRFINTYRCPQCGVGWEDEWSSQVADDCPACDTRHITPESSRELAYQWGDAYYTICPICDGGNITFRHEDKEGKVHLTCHTCGSEFSEE